MSIDLVARALASRSAEGSPGRSAYEVAVQNGFAGTEAQWLASLKGGPGDPGATGDPGAPGDPGDQGEAGKSAYDVAVLNGFVGTELQWLASLVGPGADPAVIAALQQALDTALQRIAVLESPDVLAPLVLTPDEAPGDAQPGDLIGQVTGIHPFEQIVPVDDAGGRLVYLAGKVYVGETPLGSGPDLTRDLILRRRLHKPGKDEIDVQATLTVSVLQAFLLDALPLTPTTAPQDLAAGAELADLGPLLPGETRTIAPNDGRVVFDSASEKLLRGLSAWSEGVTEYTVYRHHPGASNSPRGTTWSLTVDAADPPAVVAVPVVTGSAYEGAVLTAAPGQYARATAVVGQWCRDGAPIAGETGLTYRQVEADVGKTVTYRETASSSAGEVVGASINVGITQSGVVARLAMAAGQVILTAAPRWTWLDAAVYPVARKPEAGIGRGNGAEDYVFGHVAGASFANNFPAYPIYLRGQASITGATGRIRIDVPAGVWVRVKLAVGSGSGGATAYEWSIRDGDTATELTSASGTPPAGHLLGGDGQMHAIADWFANDQGVLVKANSGSIVIRRKTAPVATLTLRAVEVSLPDFGLNTSSANLPGNAVYVDNVAGDDVTGAGTIAKPFKHLPGDPAAGGVVPNFVMQPGSTLNLQGGQRHRPAGAFDTRGGRHIQTLRDGAAGNPVKLTSYGVGQAIIDGSQLLPTGWSAAAAGDVFNNPNAANIQMRAVTWGPATMANALCDGDGLMFPAQWPVPTNPADWYKNYPGNDGYIALDAAQYAAQVTQGASDSAGAGWRSVVVVSNAGPSNLKDRYSADAVSLVNYRVRVLNGQNRLNDYPIDFHDPATGEIRFKIENGNPLLAANASLRWIFSIVGHPYDLRREGQFAYNAARTVVFGHFATADRAVVRCDQLFYPAHDHITVENVELTRARVSAFQDAPKGSGSVRRLGIKLKDVRLTQITSDDIEGVIRVQSALQSQVAFEGIDISDCQHQGNQPFVLPPTSIDRWKMRHAGRTSLYLGLPDIVATNVDVSDQASVHGNAIALYEQAQRCRVEGFLAMNHPLGLNLQQEGDPIASRANVLRRGVVTAMRQYPGAPFASTLYLSSIGQKETDTLFEHILMGMAPIFIGASYVTHPVTGEPWAPCTGMKFKNCIIPGIVATKLEGIDFENVLIWDDDGRSSIKSYAQFTALGPASAVRVTVDGAGHFDGTITEQMQKVLTRNGDTETYTAVTLGASDNPWPVPAFGEAFALADCAITTSKVRKNFRPLLAFGSIIGTQPGSSISLPAGLGDNALFGMDRGQVFFLAPPAPGIYSLVVRQTSTHPNLTGPSAHDTTIFIVVGN